MKFGSVENPDEVDFSLPKDHPDTKQVLSTVPEKEELDICKKV